MVLVYSNQMNSSNKYSEYGLLGDILEEIQRTNPSSSILLAADELKNSYKSEWNEQNTSIKHLDEDNARLKDNNESRNSLRSFVESVRRSIKFRPSRLYSTISSKVDTGKYSPFCIAYKGYRSMPKYLGSSIQEHVELGSKKGCHHTDSNRNAGKKIPLNGRADEIDEDDKYLCCLFMMYSKLLK